MPAPSEFPVWIPDNTTNIIEPSSGQKNTGWLPGQVPPAQYFNWILNLINQWIEYFDDVIQPVLTLTVTSGDSPFPITDDYRGSTLLCDTSGGPLVFELPPAPAEGFSFTTADIGGELATNPITMERFGSQEIQGVAADYLLEAPFGSWTWTFDGTDWWISRR